jgi:transcriptional regulator with XRE-family HTH domain
MVLAPDFGDRIRLRRQALGMDQAEFARRVGVDPSTVIAWEKGRHRPTRRQGAIEAVLGISLSGDSDLKEQEYRARLEALRDDGFMTAGRVEDLLREYHERKHGPGVRERTG